MKQIKKIGTRAQMEYLTHDTQRRLSHHSLSNTHTHTITKRTKGKSKRTRARSEGTSVASDQWQRSWRTWIISTNKLKITKRRKKKRGRERTRWHKTDIGCMPEGWRANIWPPFLSPFPLPTSPSPAALSSPSPPLALSTSSSKLFY